MAEQRGKARRRLAHQVSMAAVSAAAFEIILAQVQQVALDLHFAGTAQVVASDRQAVERILAKHDVVASR